PRAGRLVRGRGGYGDGERAAVDGRRRYVLGETRDVDGKRPSRPPERQAVRSVEGLDVDLSSLIQRHHPPERPARGDLPSPPRPHTLARSHRPLREDLPHPPRRRRSPVPGDGTPNPGDDPRTPPNPP